MSNNSDRYKLAHQIVLTEYSLKKDGKGHSQVWKIKAIESDIKADKNSGVVETFIKEVEEMFNFLEQKEQEPLVTIIQKEGKLPPKAVASPFLTS